MKSDKNSGDKTISEFCYLRKALIDASSMIYAEKAGFLTELTSSLVLLSPEEVLLETKLEGIGVKSIPFSNRCLSNDQKLVTCALAGGLPVISEDKQILRQMKAHGIPYFNALMMLNYLLFMRYISTEQHTTFFQQLKDYAWYSDQVLAYGKEVYLRIVRNIRV